MPPFGNPYEQYYNMYGDSSHLYYYGAEYQVRALETAAFSHVSRVNMVSMEKVNMLVRSVMEKVMKCSKENTRAKQKEK